jgi:hypothetical protein
VRDHSFEHPKGMPDLSRWQIRAADAATVKPAQAVDRNRIGTVFFHQGLLAQIHCGKFFVKCASSMISAEAAARDMEFADDEVEHRGQVFRGSVFEWTSLVSRVFIVDKMNARLIDWRGLTPLSAAEASATRLERPAVMKGELL